MKILVVDDEVGNLDSTAALLRRWGFGVDTATDGEQAIARLKSATTPYAVALIDYRMPGKNGAETVREIRTFNSEIVLLIHSATIDRENIKASMRAGAADYIDKGEDIEYLRDRIHQSVHEFEERRQTLSLPTDPKETEKELAAMGIVGRSDALGKIGRLIPKYRASKSNILILGETGAGKEVITRALHTGHPSQFYAINCASYSGDANLLESELFGITKGTFTGAISDRAGILERANGGTVFLDEIHHLSAKAQGLLLRAIRERKVRRVGADKEYPVDFRLIAAAKPDLAERKDAGTFLPDLYYRIDVLRIAVPPLRDRPTDIEPLIQHFLGKHNETAPAKARQFLMKTIRVMEKYSWPGNVGELQAYVDRLLTDVDSPIIRPDHLDERFELFPEVRGDEAAGSFSQLKARQEQEKSDFLASAIRNTPNVNAAARSIGVKSTSLRSMIGKLGLKL